MSDIIKLILFNILLIGTLYYDKRYSIPIIVIMMIYWVTIKSSIRTKIVEGNDFFENFIKLPEFSKYDYSTTLPNSILHNSQDQGYSSIFSFFNGGGKYSTLKNDRMTTLEETNNLLDQLIGMFEKGQQNCKGEFEKFSECSRECGYGTQEQVYRITQEKGPNGIDCPYTEGHEIKIPCILRDCNLDEKCRHNYECRSRNCDNGICKRVGECDKDKLYHCYTEKECLGLNGKYNTSSRNRYEWDSRTNTCSFEYTPKTEYRFFMRPDIPKDKDPEKKYKCDEENCVECDTNEECEYDNDDCDDNCNKSCDITCENGTLNGDNCKCECNGGWEGDECGECNLDCHNGSPNAECNKCKCVGEWKGDECDECGLICGNDGTPNKECNECECVGEWKGDNCDGCGLKEKGCKEGYELNEDECKCEDIPGFCGSDRDCSEYERCVDGKCYSYLDYYWTNLNQSCENSCKEKDYGLQCDIDSLNDIKEDDKLDNYKNLYKKDITSLENWKGGPGGSGCINTEFIGTGNYIITVTGNTNKCYVGTLERKGPYQELSRCTDNSNSKIRAVACKCKKKCEGNWKGTNCDKCVGGWEGGNCDECKLDCHNGSHNAECTKCDCNIGYDPNNKCKTFKKCTITGVSFPNNASFPCGSDLGSEGRYDSLNCKDNCCDSMKDHCYSIFVCQTSNCRKKCMEDRNCG